MTIFARKRISSLLFVGFLAGLFAASASAKLLELKPGEKSIEGVKLAKEAVFMADGKPVTLAAYASGIRKKKVALFWAKVYVGQVFAAPGLTVPPATIEDARTVLNTQPVVALTMTFLRDVSAGRQKDAFEDSLETNGVDPHSEAVKPLFAIVEKGGEAKDTLTTTIVFEHRKDGTEWLHYENGKGELQSQSFEKGTLAKVLSIWFGKPADSGMERLQNQFLGNAD
ncbi:MAG: chalcone isomerase family protein [Bdellovibrionales bacterium]|nr:chalcone isomerase family protein [Bdellovibrionales bacterium]